jgi:hypothetical protein
MEMNKKELSQYILNKMKLKEEEVLKSETPEKLAFKYADEGVRFTDMSILNMSYENRSIASVVSSKWHFSGFSKNEMKTLKNPYQAVDCMFYNERVKLMSDPSVLNLKNENNISIARVFASEGYMFSLKELKQLTSDKEAFKTALVMLSKEKDFESKNADGNFIEFNCLNNIFINKHPEILSWKNEENKNLIEALYLNNPNHIRFNYLNHLRKEDLKQSVDLIMEKKHFFEIRELMDLNKDVVEYIIKKSKKEYTEENLLLFLNKKNQNIIYDILKEKIKEGFTSDSQVLLNLKKKNMIGINSGKSIKDIMEKEDLSSFLKNKNNIYQKTIKHAKIKK